MVVKRENLMDTAPDVLFGDVKKNWGWLLALGILSIILGTIGLGMTFGLTIVSVLFFGALLLVGGVLQLVNAFQCKGWKSVLWHALIALLYVLGGIAIMLDPILASTLFTLMLAGALIGVGVVRIIMAFQNRAAKGWYWALIAGIISILLGVIIIAQWPISGLWVIGLFVAIELIFNGWAYVFIALAARNAAKTGAEGPRSTATGTL
jgi:uncharacterized membrane protein HdeD (DUF308 family)